VVKLGVGKTYVVLGLDQGTVSGERGVMRISPSSPIPGGENSTGILPKFKVRETVSTRSHSWIAAGVSLIPISLYVTGCL
jgi:hypothetical protein